MGCGLLLWIGNASPVEIVKILDRLEEHKLAGEPSPVGGHGAGIALIANCDFNILKVGGVDGPSRKLAMKLGKLSKTYPIILGHVRRASKEFLKSIPYSWAAQPYACKCLENKVVSIHNGLIENYNELYRLTSGHVYESYNPGIISSIIDSEVIPHVYSDFLKTGNVEDATKNLYNVIKGNNTWITLAIIREDIYAGIYHKGKTRGLNVYTSKDKLIAVTRAEALEKPLEDMRKEVEIKPKEEACVLLLYEIIFNEEETEIKKIL
ncbi:MAG: hypothetical protein DRJ44_07505 [Thermoprotei archaeon]|nr:MAG: hypothetical protein DRJ44_07505 [Thermoprotei archaeon]